MMSRLLEDNPDLLQAPWFIKYAHYGWAVFFLGTGVLFFWETGMRSAKVLLYEQYGVPQLVMPGLYLIVGIVLAIKRQHPRYWHAIILSIPMWVHLAATLLVEVPPPSIWARGWFIVAFVFGSASVEEFMRRHG